MTTASQLTWIFFAALTASFVPLKAQQQHLFVVKSNPDNPPAATLFDTLGNPLLCGKADYFFRCDSLIFSSSYNLYTLWSANGQIKLADSFEEVRCAWHHGISFMAKKQGLWRYYLADGRQALPGAWLKVTDFFEGVARVYDGTADIYINLKGEKLDRVSDAVSEHFRWNGIYESPVSVAEIPTFRHPEYSIFKGPSGMGIRRKSDNKIILEAAYDRIISNKGEYVIIVQNRQFGVFHLKKEILIIPCRYSHIHDEI